MLLFYRSKLTNIKVSFHIIQAAKEYIWYGNLMDLRWDIAKKLNEIFKSHCVLSLRSVRTGFFRVCFYTFYFKLFLRAFCEAYFLF